MLSVILVAAGSSRRMGFDKLLAPLAGQPVLTHTVQRFLDTPEVSEIVLVCPAERYAQLGLPSDSRLIRVDGGAERHHSVQAGLDRLSPDSRCVAIHDGARPLVTSEAILACYHQALETGAATLARPATETIKRANEHLHVTESVSRENLWFMETPQTFATDRVKEAYTEVARLDQLVTDEVSALQLIGQATTLVPAPCYNPKITYPTDLDLAEKFL